MKTTKERREQLYKHADRDNIGGAIGGTLFREIIFDLRTFESQLENAVKLIEQYRNAEASDLDADEFLASIAALKAVGK